MSVDQVREALNTGRQLVDIGQLTPDATKYLRRLVRLDLVEVETVHHFPRPKKAYAAFDVIAV